MTTLERLEKYRLAYATWRWRNHIAEGMDDKPQPGLFELRSETDLHMAKLIREAEDKKPVKGPF